MKPDLSPLLDWHTDNGRALPWRASAGRTPDPYKIWLSEIMLQQTGTGTVAAYYERFLARFPTLEKLARGPLEEILHLWAGLGYYSRARNLHRCAAELMNRHNGRFPSDPASLRKLPGIGPYTGNAIAAFAFNIPVVAVDGNVERIAARLFAFDLPLPQNRSALHALASELNDCPKTQKQAGDFMQALFDFGATLCTPKNPACFRCPLTQACLVFQRGKDPHSFPVKTKPAPKPVRYGKSFYLEQAGKILLEKRPDSGLLGGTWQIPGTEWGDQPPALKAALQETFTDAVLSDPDLWEKTGQTKHVFTHFTLHLEIYRPVSPLSNILPAGNGRALVEMEEKPLSTLMKKACAIGAQETEQGRLPSL